MEAIAMQSDDPPAPGSRRDRKHSARHTQQPDSELSPPHRASMMIRTPADTSSLHGRRLLPHAHPRIEFGLDDPIPELASEED